ncbi:hypothetical protein [Streptomyces sp. 3N207]|uniref:hypothetical protein n=1 Tax=Streptomyces sp. 3N207 TaxID=3457417 RepID=UPI003FD03FBC
MSYVGTAPRAEYAEAVEQLAARVLGALQGAGGTGPGVLGAYLRGAADRKVALAAVRVLGADVLAPYVLRGLPVDAEEAEAVAAAYRVFPLTMADPGAARITASRDWATAQVLALSGWRLADVPLPDAPPAPYAASEESQGFHWQSWSVCMAQLSPLALPALDSPVHAAAHRHAVWLSRSVARSMLRRDPATAIGLARWLTLVRVRGTDAPLDPAPVLDHMLLFGARDARTALEVAISRWMLRPNGRRRSR